MVTVALAAGQSRVIFRVCESAASANRPTPSVRAHGAPQSESNGGDAYARAAAQRGTPDAPDAPAGEAESSTASHAPSGSNGSAAMASTNERRAAASSPRDRAHRPRMAHHGPYDDSTSAGSATSGSPSARRPAISRARPRSHRALGSPVERARACKAALAPTSV